MSLERKISTYPSNSEEHSFDRDLKLQPMACSLAGYYKRCLLKFPQEFLIVIDCRGIEKQYYKLNIKHSFWIAKYKRQLRRGQMNSRFKVQLVVRIF